MAYEPTNWKAGDVVTSAKLNKLENGVASAGALVVHESESFTLDKTWQEIHDAALSGPVVTVLNTGRIVLVDEVGSSERAGYFVTLSSDMQPTYSTQDADGYPVLEGDS